jgi:FkbM family methyltransferase
MNLYRYVSCIPGGRRLTRNAIRFLPRSLTAVTADIEGVRLHLDLKEEVDRQYAEAIYDRDEILFLTRSFVPGAAFLDVGANIGLYSLAFAKQHPHARVFAFEPDAYNISKLRRNIEANGIANITLCEYAVSDSDESRDLHLNFAGNRGGNSLLLSQIPYTGAPERDVRVPCKTLLSALQANEVTTACVMKMDIEGFEYPVLRAFITSAPRSLFPRAIVVEAFGRNIAATGGSPIELLIHNGYQLVNHTGYNFFFLLQSEAQKS